jgi:hypothetical protein
MAGSHQKLLNLYCWDKSETVVGGEIKNPYPCLQNRQLEFKEISDFM